MSYRIPKKTVGISERWEDILVPILVGVVAFGGQSTQARWHGTRQVSFKRSHYAAAICAPYSYRRLSSMICYVVSIFCVVIRTAAVLLLIRLDYLTSSSTSSSSSGCTGRPREFARP